MRELLTENYRGAYSRYKELAAIQNAHSMVTPVKGRARRGRTINVNSSILPLRGKMMRSF